MRAVGYQKSLPIDDPSSLQDIELPDPTPGPHDLLVEVAAVSVNPVDTKVRMRAEPESGWKVLGFDAAGTVRAVGEQVTLFKPGDAVFHAGDITRQGTNAELHLVDERIAGPAPASLSTAEAAALPLTSITAWEILFDRFRIPEGGGDGDLLVLGGAGGVGSMLIQLAKTLTGLRVIATASRPESGQWCRDLGADAVVDHSQPLGPQLDALDSAPRYVAALTASDRHLPTIAEVIRPQGEICMIDDPDQLDVTPLKRKSISFHWELMFTRPMFQTDDMIAQHRLLGRVAELVDQGRIRSTMMRELGPIDAATLREAHRQQESGRSVGKTVLAGFPS